MRTTDEQLKEIMRRSDGIAEKRKLRGRMLAEAASLCACAVLMIAVISFLPRTAPQSSGIGGGRYGSLILGTAYTGYVVIGVFAFLAGICVTVLSQHYRKWKELNRKEEDGRP